MKLTAFEKSPFDPTAHQRTTIQTSDNGQNSVEMIRDDYTKPFLSSVKQRDIRTIDVPIEIVNRYSDGHTFKGNFKVVDVTSGEPEIVHNTRQPAVTKQIDVNLRANLDLRKLDEPDDNQDNVPEIFLPKLDFTFSEREFRALISILIGAELDGPIVFYDGDDRVVQVVGGNRVTSKNALRRFLIGGDTKFLTAEKLITSAQDLIDNLSDNRTLPEGESATNNPIFSYNKIIRHDSLRNPINLATNDIPNPFYFKTTTPVKHKYQVKEAVLQRSGESITLNLPYRETKEIETPVVRYTTNTGANPVINQPRVWATAPPPALANYAPIDLSANDIIVNERTTTVAPSGPQIRSIIYDIGLSANFNNFLNNIREFTTLPNALLAILNNLNLGTDYFSISFANNGSTAPGLPDIAHPNYSQGTAFFVGSYGRSGITYPINSIENRVAAWMELWIPAGGLSYDRLKLLAEEQLFGSSIDDWKIRVANLISDYIRKNFFQDDPWVDEDLQKQAILSGVGSTGDPLIPFKVPTGDLKQQLGISQDRLKVQETDFGALDVFETGLGIQTMNTDISRDRIFRLGSLNSSLDRNGKLAQIGALPLFSPNQEFPSQSITIHDKLRYEFLGTFNKDLLVQKVVTDDSNFESVEPPFSNNPRQEGDDFTRAIVKKNNEIPLSIGSGWNIPRETRETTDAEKELVMDFPNGRIFNLPADLESAFDVTFPQDLVNRLGIKDNMPTIQNWLDNDGSIFSEFVRLQFIIRNAPEQPEDDQDDAEIEPPEPINLLSRIDKSWPWVSVSDLSYDEDNKRIIFGLSRGADAPIPPRNFFDSVLINGRAFNASSGSYSQDRENNQASWSWPNSLNFLRNRTRVPLVLRKSGRSVTNAINESRLVRKATVETNAYKDLPAVVAGLFIKDIDFSSSYFKITFSGAVQADDFSALFIESGGLEITRQMRSADAVRSVAGGDTIFQWNSLPEFGSLMKNKSYTLGIIKNGSSLEQAFFIPRPDKVHWAWPVAMRSVATGVSVDFKINDPVDRLVFIAMGILNTDQTNFLALKDSNEWEQTKAGDIITAEYKGGALGALAVGDKKILSFQVKDYPELAINFLKTTDFLFDTIIILNTNLKAVFLKDQVGNDLLHPSDFRSLEYQTEQGLRHLILELNNDIVSEQVTLVNRDMVKYDHRKIGQVLLLKRIGSFKQFPNIRVHSSKSRETTIDQNNLTHVKALPESLNYHMVFPALLDEDDVLLAQDLFSRVADYNEFLIWVSGGDIAPKNRGMKGFRFVDIVKSLCANELDIGYVDGRFTSGPGFEMALSQVR